MATAKLVNSEVIAGMVGVESTTVEKWGRQGKIPRVVINRQVVRFDPEKVMAALEKLEEPAETAPVRRKRA